MASAYSILKTYAEFIPPFDLGIADKALASKQGDFDLKAAMLQDKMDQLSDMLLYRGVDRAYLQDRLDKVADQINNSVGSDLTHRGVQKAFEASISDVVDPTVMQGYQSSQNFKALKDEIAYVKKNDTKSYNKMNEAYVMSDAYAWANSEDIADSYVGGVYTPYIDVEAKLSERAAAFQKDNGEFQYDVLDGSGRKTTIKVKDMSEHQLRQAAMASLNDADKGQLKIQSWYNYGSLDDQSTRNIAAGVVSERTRLLDAESAFLQRQIAFNPDNQSAVTQLQAVSAEQGRMMNFATSFQHHNKEDLAYFIETEKVTSMVARANRKVNMSISQGSDAAHWKAVGMQLNAAKFSETTRHNAVSEATALRGVLLKEEEARLKALEAGGGGLGGIDQQGYVYSSYAGIYGSRKVIGDKQGAVGVTNTGSKPSVDFSVTMTEAAESMDFLISTLPQEIRGPIADMYSATNRTDPDAMEFLEEQIRNALNTLDNSGTNTSMAWSLLDPDSRQQALAGLGEFTNASITVSGKNSPTAQAFVNKITEGASNKSFSFNPISSTQVRISYNKLAGGGIPMPTKNSTKAERAAYMASLNPLGAKVRKTKVIDFSDELKYIALQELYKPVKQNVKVGTLSQKVYDNATVGHQDVITKMIGKKLIGIGDVFTSKTASNRVTFYRNGKVLKYDENTFYNLPLETRLTIIDNPLNIIKYVK